MYGRENIVLSKIFEMEILMDLQILRSSKPESNIFSDWCVSIIKSISITQKQMKVET